MTDDFGWPGLTALAGLAPPRPEAHGIAGDVAGVPLRLGLHAPGILRLRLGEPALPRPDYGLLVGGPESVAVAIAETDGGTRIEGGGLVAFVADDPLRLEVRGADAILRPPRDAHFTRRFRIPPFARTPRGWLVAFDLAEDEPVYGHGEKWGRLDHRGQLLRSWNEDALGVNAEISYKNVPFAWTPRGFGLFLHTTAPVTHAVGHAPVSHRTWVMEVEDEVLDLFVLVADGPAGILERYTFLTGRPPATVPRWSLQPWLSKAWYRDEDELLADARKVRELDLPVSVITLDGRAWLDTRTRFAFEWDASRYPDPAATIAKLDALGLRLCVWEYPLVSVHHPLFERMRRNGWLLKDGRTGEAYVHEWDPAPFGKDLPPLPPSGLVDFTHPDAYAFWRQKNVALLRSGPSVVKSDFGEQVPPHAVAFDGSDGRRLHNVYPILYNRCVYEATLEARGEGLVFARSGYVGSQRWPAQWGGDPQADWGGMAASIRGMLSWAHSGSPWYATDIGGFYAGPPSPELFLRWTQNAVFASHMRFHGIGDRAPWAFGDEVLELVRRALQLRVLLIPYIETALAEAAATGMPLCRSMAVAFPEEPEARVFEHQYLFGPDLLFAPVLRPGGGVRVWLPPGPWRRHGSARVTEGPRRLDLELEPAQMALFARPGSFADRFVSQEE